MLSSTVPGNASRINIFLFKLAFWSGCFNTVAEMKLKQVLIAGKWVCCCDELNHIVLVGGMWKRLPMWVGETMERLLGHSCGSLKDSNAEKMQFE